MGFDLFQSRRNMNEHCTWWTRLEGEDIEESKLIYKRVASGTFSAQEVSSETSDNNVIGGTFMVRKTSVTIKSSDNLSDIKPNDWIDYQGEIWRVENVQKKKARIQNSEFGKPSSVSHYWYLSLIKS